MTELSFVHSKKAKKYAEKIFAGYYLEMNQEQEKQIDCVVFKEGFPLFIADLEEGGYSVDFLRQKMPGFSVPMRKWHYLGSKIPVFFVSIDKDYSACICTASNYFAVAPLVLDKDNKYFELFKCNDFRIVPWEQCYVGSNPLNYILAELQPKGMMQL